jgi:hypothetical protein
MAVTTSFSTAASNISLSISDRVVASFSPSAVAVASTSIGLAALLVEAEGGVVQSLAICSQCAVSFDPRIFLLQPKIPPFSIRGRSVSIPEDLVG